MSCIQLSQCKLSAPNWSRILTLGYIALRSTHCANCAGDEILRKSAILVILHAHLSQIWF